MPEDLFREESVEKMSSPDQLDELLVIVKPKGWVALTSLFLLIFAAIIWSFVGEIPITALGKGILLEPTGLQSITNHTDGRLSQILAKTGDDVTEGQVIAVLENPLLDLKLSSGRRSLVSLREILKNLEDEYAVEKEIKQKSLTKKIEMQKKMVESQQERLSSLEGKKEKEPSSHEDIQAQIDQQKAILEETNQTLSLLQSEFILSETSAKIDEMRWQLQKTQADVDLLEEQKKGLFIAAPHAGRVIQLDVDLGKEIPAGTSILWIEPLSAKEKPLPFYCFVPIRMGERIKAGMDAQITLLAIDRQTYGYLLGQVTEVMPYAASASAQQLAGISSKDLREYLQIGPSSMLVVITPTPDLNTPTGYKWTTAEGPGERLVTGDKGDARIIIERKRPISYVLPLFH